MKNERNKLDQGITKTLCLPFFSILLALGNPEVDYFSLDVEGSELPILQTIPWHNVKIKVSKTMNIQSDFYLSGLLSFKSFIVSKLTTLGIIHWGESLRWKQNRSFYEKEWIRFETQISSSTFDYPRPYIRSGRKINYEQRKIDTFYIHINIVNKRRISTAIIKGKLPKNGFENTFGFFNLDIQIKQLWSGMVLLQHAILFSKMVHKIRANIVTSFQICMYKLFKSQWCIHPQPVSRCLDRKYTFRNVLIEIILRGYDNLL